MSTPAAKTSPTKRDEPPNEPDTHITSIDLPGETVQFWRSTKKVRVILRKHRDVLFDIQLFKGMVYTVQADQSDFYNAGAKKIVFKGQRLTFQDGERIHLWISREFRGELIIKANDKILGRYEPNKLDPAVHDAEPSTKPAPLIVIWHNAPVANSPPMGAGSPVAQNATFYPKSAEKSATDAWAESQIPQTTFLSQAPLQEANDQIMHVIEVKHDDCICLLT